VPRQGTRLVFAQACAFVFHSDRRNDRTATSALPAIRSIAREAAENGLLDREQAQAVCAVKNVKSSGARAGNWLSLDQAHRLIATPAPTTLKGRYRR
jgi:hypothetical protein